MADKPSKARTAAAGQDLAERMAATIAAPVPAPRSTRARPAARPSPPGPPPAEQKRPDKWGERIPLTTDKEMKRALELARLDDGIEATTRIRAMIVLWQENDRFRSQVDRMAATPRVQGSRRIRTR
jgi:hypothetical protein